MSAFRIRFRKRGKHYRCRMFSAPNRDETFAMNGELLFDDQEFDSVKAAMPGVEFIDDEETMTKPCDSTNNPGTEQIKDKS